MIRSKQSRKTRMDEKTSSMATTPAGSDVRRLTFAEYANHANSTAIYPNRGNNPYYAVLGLCGEAGEVAEKLKKIMRDKDGVISDRDRNEVAKELGDVLWYVQAVAHEFGISLSEVAAQNSAKLLSRKKRGKLQGNGDNR